MRFSVLNFYECRMKILCLTHSIFLGRLEESKEEKRSELPRAETQKVRLEAVLQEERLAQPPRALLLWVTLGELNGKALGFSPV